MKNGKFADDSRLMLEIKIRIVIYLKQNNGFLHSVSEMTPNLMLMKYFFHEIHSSLETLSFGAFKAKLIKFPTYTQDHDFWNIF